MLLDLTPQPEAMVRSAPNEPAAAREYRSLRHKMAVNYVQARWIRHRLVELEVWILVSQVLALEPQVTRAPKSARMAEMKSAAPLLVEPVGEYLTRKLPVGNFRVGKSDIISGLSPSARAAEAIGNPYGPASRTPYKLFLEIANDFT